jgi:hypothetical protein
LPTPGSPAPQGWPPSSGATSTDLIDRIQTLEPEVPPDTDPPIPPSKPRMLAIIAVAALVVAFVVLHLTGVLGSGAH